MRKGMPRLARFILRQKLRDYLAGSPFVSLVTIHAAIRLSGLTQKQVASILGGVYAELDGDYVPRRRYADLVTYLRANGLLPPQ